MSEDPDWILVGDAFAYVEAAQQCYREKAVELVLQARDNLTLRSRTARSSPKWVASVGEERFHSDHGKREEVYRPDLLRLWPERQKDVAPTKAGSNVAQRHGQPISDGIRSAKNELWPGGIPTHVMAKERDAQIIKWLTEHSKKVSKNISRTIQRVLKAEREAHQGGSSD